MSIGALKDMRGRDIIPGARVVYNLSGGVAIGTVSQVDKGCPSSGTRRWATNPVVWVVPDTEWRSLASGRGESRLRIIDYPGNPIRKILVVDA